MEGVRAVAGMVTVQVVLAGVNIFFEMALNDGMSTAVLVAYRYLFAAAFMAPPAFFLERKTRPKLTFQVLVMAFISGFFGSSLSQNLYLQCIRIANATFATAMTNLIPAITFVLAVLCRLEKLAIGEVSGQAKVAGTLLGISGAMLLTFYKGVAINLWETHIKLGKAHHTNQVSKNHVLGSMLAFLSCLTYAIWLIIQAQMMKIYPFHYTNTALMCLMGAIQCLAYGFCVERDLISWKLGFNIRLLTVAYSGALASGLVLSFMNWCIRKRGPLFVSVFNPLMLVIVALLSSLLLDQKLHLGSVLGSALIVAGLYLVLWGKGREATIAKGMESSVSITDVDQSTTNDFHLNGELENGLAVSPK